MNIVHSKTLKYQLDGGKKVKDAKYQLDVGKKVKEPVKLEIRKSENLQRVIANIRREGYVRGWLCEVSVFLPD